jgi:aminoglycoside/choline kinase family phosphotransferase
MNPNKTVPDHHDAEIVLKLYELRREAVMRQSRDAMAKFLPRSYADFAAVIAPDHPQNAAWRQVTSYFEMAWGFARHGIANPDLLAENTGEGFLLFAKVHPYLQQYRREHAPLAFKNAEWMLEHSGAARQRFELFQARVQKQLGTK